MFNSFSTKGLELIKTLGTFLNKYYPYKDFVTNLMQANENIGDQLDSNLIEAKNIVSYEKCPEYHTEQLYKIELNQAKTFLTCGLENFKVGGDYQWITSPKVNDMGNGSFSTPNIISIDKLTYKIINGTNIDFLLKNNKILFKEKPKQNYVWGWNVKFDATYFYDTVGFLFGSKELTIILLKMFRYGMTQNLLEQFLKLFFNTKNVTIKDYKVSDIYIKNSIPITHNFKSGKMLWGNFDWGMGNWGEEIYNYDTYYLNNEIYYVATIKDIKFKYSNNLLQHLKNAFPIWLKLNIIPTYENNEVYNNSMDNINIYSGKSINSYSRTGYDGILVIDNYKDY